MAIPSERWDELWRWLALTVAGTILPFVIAAGAIWLDAANFPSGNTVLGRGELFIPASIMNAEALWFFSIVALSRKKLWLPLLAIACGGSAVLGAIAYGAITALDAAPQGRINVSPTEIHFLTGAATVLSASEFLEALVLGLLGVTLYVRYGRQPTAKAGS